VSQAHPFFDGVDWDAVYSRSVVPLYVPKLKAKSDISNFDNMFTRVRA
jgi:hypothetical protein